MVVSGVRRGGKTSFLHRHITDPLDSGDDPGTHLLVSLDEVQVVAGWETVVRRLLDAHDTEIFVSGSSAKLLSTEVHTSLRGRSMDVLVHPFSFRESLRHAGDEPVEAYARLGPDARAAVDAALRRYLTIGGFPEAHGLDALDRVPLLRGYVDMMLLRDVIERHHITNVEALRRLQRHLLSNPATAFSVSKFHRDLRSQALPVAEETLHHMLSHLEDAFMVRLVAMHTPSERQRLRNPRKVYPVDPGLIPVFERGGREQRGRSLETAIVIELERRTYDVGWVRALAAAAEAYPDARPLLPTLDPTPPSRSLPRQPRVGAGVAVAARGRVIAAGVPHARSPGNIDRVPQPG